MRRSSDNREFAADNQLQIFLLRGDVGPHHTCDRAFHRLGRAPDNPVPRLSAQVPQDGKHRGET